MDARQAVKQAVQKLRLVESQEDEEARLVEAGKDDEPGELGEFQVAEYVIFLLAFDTYTRYVEERTGEEDPRFDQVIQRGLTLLRKLDTEVAQVKGFLDENVPTATHKKMLDRAFRLRATSVKGAGRRALGLRTVLNRGGPQTMRAVFETNKNLRRIREGMAAAMLEDASDALKVFAGFPIRNQRIRYWIRMAAKTAGLGFLPKSAVEAASEEAATDQKDAILREGIEKLSASTADAVKGATEKKAEKLAQVEEDAREAARATMELSGEEDRPLTRSEVVGVATAAAVAAATDPSDSQNIPSPLRKLDDEQRSAALTDGRVLVAAGAGAGKSTTLVARIGYLVNERRVLPSRILATSFNTKAASELKERIGKTIGGDALQQMSVGTMHSLFRRFIGEYGTGEEKTALGLGGGQNGFIQTGSSVARTVQRMWEECFNTDERPTPRLKNMLKYKSQWSGNNISPAEARAAAKNDEERDAADWYELYEGLKGGIPGWEPPCEEKAREVVDEEYQEKLQAWRRRGGRGSPPKKRGTTFETFMSRYRPGDIRLGDFDDMLTIFRDVLKREPAVRKALQKMYDHIMVDECQDLNQVQHDIITMMSEHVTDGEDGKSLWMVGDDKQSIYHFRGARPDLFTDLHEKEGWNTRMIKTNYRCEPEIVEHANKLIAHNEGQIPMEARPNPGRPRGMGSIRVENPMDEAEAALRVVEEIKGNLEVPGAEISENAVLCRTNKELHAYETACIVRGVPYARKGASSFLGSPETSAVLGYVQLALGDDFEKMQKALKAVVNKPNRFFVGPDAGSRAVEDALSQYARRVNQSVKDVNPLAALRDPDFVDILAEKLAKTTRGFKFDKTVEKLEELARSIGEMQANAEQPGYSTTDLFEEILSLRGTASAVDPDTGRTVWIEQSFRESLQADLRDATGDGDDEIDEDDDEEDQTKGLGNVGFLFKLAEVDPTDPLDLENDPSTPNGFKAKMERLAARARDLRIDITKWDKAQQALPPDQRRKPPGVFLGTVHATKGAQWDHTYVQMPKGKFPFEPPQKPGAPPPDPEEMKEQMEGERRLAYVALTRAAKTLSVICPNVVGGKRAGVSQFVDEAGLTLGENTPKVGTEEAAEAEAEAVTTKEAAKRRILLGSEDYQGPLPEGWDVDDDVTPWTPEEN